MKKFKFTFLILTFLFISCGGNSSEEQLMKLEKELNSIADDYVKLALKVGVFDADYVDAYLGPDEWKPNEEELMNDTLIFVKLADEVEMLLDKLESLGSYKADELLTLRYKYLSKQLLSVKGKIFMIRGGEFTFDEEAKVLYDSEPPVYSEEYFNNLLNELDKILPGGGDVSKRFTEYKNNFVIPVEKLDTVFQTAIREARKRTMKYIELPTNENFTVEYVNNKSWSGYNWYKGNNFSVIQLNTDFPIYIDRAIDLASHEGYPGHHVYNVLLENNLYRNKKWNEFSIYVLFSPPSLIAEGSANYGIHVAFPEKERLEYEKNVLFPLAGLDASKVEEYYNILSLTSKLSYAGNEAARNYLNGEWSKEESVNWLVKYALFSPERAEQRIKFIEKYRSYVINYNYGQDLVKEYIEKNGGTENNTERRWKLFKELLSTPQTPSGLK